MYRTSKNKIYKRVGVSTIVAAGALVTGVGIAGASSPAAHKSSSAVTAPLSKTSAKHGRSSMVPAVGHRPGGTVTLVSASSITVKDPQGTSSTFTIDASTKVTKDRATATLADLAVGEHVRIIPSSSSATTAAGIEIELARVAGQVVSVDASSITVSDRDGFYRTISVGTKTAYSKGGASAALGDVTTGSFVVAEGTVDANHTTLDATAVGIGQPRVISAGGSGPMGMDPQGMGGATPGSGFAGPGANFN